MHYLYGHTAFKISQNIFRFQFPSRQLLYLYANLGSFVFEAETMEREAEMEILNF